jgi:acetyltransferase-like isoleucine patch superfamily enzyme
MIYILGKGGHAKTVSESLGWQSHEMLPLNEEHKIVRSTMLTKTQLQEIINGEAEAPPPGDYLINGIGIGIDIGVPRDRIALYEKYQDNPWIDVVDGSARWGNSPKLVPEYGGAGIYIGPFAFIGADVTIGRNVMVNHGAHVSHDCEIGDHTVISIGAQICGGVKLGRACAIGAGAIIVQNVELKDETRVPAGTVVVGQDDFRKPVSVAPGGRAYAFKDGEGFIAFEDGDRHPRLSPDPNP